MEKKHEFYDYNKEHIDTDSQKQGALSKIEELIYKPFQEGRNDITNLTEEEFKQLCELDVEELRKTTTINIKTLLLLEATQKTIGERKESILKAIREKRKKEEQENER